MSSAEKLPDGWLEPIAEGMWKPDELFGIPRAANAVHIPIVALAILQSSWIWLYVSAGLHFACVAMTQWDPEWPAVFQDFLNQPGELDP